MRIKNFSIVVMTLMLLAGAGSADAQYREDRWEFALGTFYQLGAELDFDGGGYINTDDDFTFIIDTGYNFSPKLQANFGLEFGSIGYDATGVDESGNDFDISGSYDQWVLAANLIYHFSEGPLTPYVGAGIGYTWIDTNVPDGPPQTSCWWDPWWGYVCYNTYPTNTESAFSYQALIGLRYEFTDVSFMKFSYTSQWVDLPNANGTPRFDVIGLEIGWMF